MPRLLPSTVTIVLPVLAAFRGSIWRTLALSKDQASEIDETLTPTVIASLAVPYPAALAQKSADSEVQSVDSQAVTPDRALADRPAETK